MESRVKQVLKEKILENPYCMIWLFDEQGNIIKSNELAQKELGYVDEKDRISITEIFRREFVITQTGVSYSRRESMSGFAYRRNETCFPVNYWADVLECENDTCGICYAVNQTDEQSARKQLDKAREKSEYAMQIRNEFVSNVTHELRTPVNGIKGIATSLFDTELTQEQKNLLGIIERCCDNMSNIINDLLDFSKLEAGKFTLDERKFCFRSFLDNVIEAALPRINEKGLILRVNVTPDVPEYLIGDELRLTQIINNLLSNSIKFTNVGQITIEVNKSIEEEDGTVELFFMVMDTGIGIKKQDMDKLFKSFSQVDPSITRQYGGTGLGLSITKQLVELMQGSVFVESERGKGSTFSFSVRVKLANGGEENEPEHKSMTGFLYDTMPIKNLMTLSIGGSEEPSNAVEDIEAYDVNQAFVFGTKENQKELNKNMEKLNLCIEMDNWEKAEEFAKTVKILIGDEKTDLKRSVFRLELALRREDKQKSQTLYDELEQLLGDRFHDE